MTKNDLAIIEKYKASLPAGQKILVSGASGFVGSSLCRFLSSADHMVFTLVRKTPQSEKEIYWNPEIGQVNQESLEGFDYVIHLAGESIAQRWSSEKKRKILESRVLGTTLICQTLSTLNRKPKALITASAIGFYGDSGEKICDESSSQGDGFLANVCSAWEAPSKILASGNVRTVQLRIGVVLSPLGGALKMMMLPFRLGLGGPIGAGQRYMSWIALDDLIYAIYHCLANDNLRGAVNGVAPEAVTNLKFTKTLGAALKRPAIFPIPPFILKLIFGEMANEALLASTRVTPKKLLESGFQFTFPNLSDALLTDIR